MAVLHRAKSNSQILQTDQDGSIYITSYLTLTQAAFPSKIGPVKAPAHVSEVPVHVRSLQGPHWTVMENAAPYFNDIP